MVLGAFTAGLIKGAADVGTAGLQAVPANLEENLKEMGVLYNNANEKFNQSLKVAEANIANIERIADDLGIAPGVVSSVYQATGGKEDETRKQLKNMLDTYDNQIPTVDIPTSKTKGTSIDSVNTVEIAPKKATEKGLLKSFGDLFKYYGTDEVINIFAEKQGISPERVRKILSGTFDDLIPEAQYKVKPSPEAMLAGMEKPEKQPGFLDTGTTTKTQFDEIVKISKFVRENPDKFSKFDRELAAGLPNDFLAAEGDPFLSNAAATLASSIIAIPTTDNFIPKNMQDMVNDAREIIKNAGKSSTVSYDKNAINSMMSIITPGEGRDFDVDAFTSAYRTLIQSKEIERAPKDLSNDDIYIQSLATRILRANPKITMQQAIEEAIAFVKTNPTKDSLDNYYAKELGPDGVVRMRQIPMTDAQGNPSIPKKLENQLNKQISIIGESFDNIGSLKRMMIEDHGPGSNNTFATLVTDIRLGIGDITSLIGMPNVAKALNNANIQKSLQQRISFVKQTKEEIFDDPRLSDKDLQIIIDYIGVLYDPTISNERSLAALLNIEKTLVNAYIRNLIDRYPSIDVAQRLPSGKINFTTDSIAKIALDNLLMSNGIKTVDEFSLQQRSARQQKEYADLTSPYRTQVSNSLQKILYFYDVETRTFNNDAYKTQFETDVSDFEAVAGKSLEAVREEAAKEKNGGYDALAVLRAAQRRRSQNI
tara:strand:+ start:1554 stop:3680 length:2127 start_codon:yes stop_codon:yes gene_type:complete